MSEILDVKSICKTFLFEGKEVLVLKDISFSVQEKEFIGIIGPSGCGKSTLLELIAGISRPDCGDILKYGKSISGQAGHAGYMPQDDLLLPWLSLLQNAILPVKISKGDEKRALDKAKSLLPDFGLEGFENYKPWQLSGGMKQRTAFLRTVMTNEDILLLDEPFANLDALTRLQLQTWLKSIHKKLNLTIILVTHDIDEAIRLSDAIYVMDSIPAPFIHKEIVPENLKTEENDYTDPLWSELKLHLTTKLFK